MPATALILQGSREYTRPGAMWRLLIETDEGKRHVVALTGAEYDVGRRKGAKICLGEENVSRRHCVLRRTGRDFVIEDIGSSYGTFVNGERLGAHVPRQIAHGDCVKIADYVLTFQNEVTVPLPVLASPATADAADAPHARQGAAMPLALTNAGHPESVPSPNPLPGESRGGRGWTLPVRVLPGPANLSSAAPTSKLALASSAQVTAPGQGRANSAPSPSGGPPGSPSAAPPEESLPPRDSPSRPTNDARPAPDENSLPSARDASVRASTSPSAHFIQPAPVDRPAQRASSPVPPWRFVMIVGPTPGAEYTLAGPRQTLGRHEDANIVINDPSLSRIHCENRGGAGGRWRSGLRLNKWCVD